MTCLSHKPYNLFVDITKKCGIFVNKSRTIQTVEAEIKAVDAPTESSGWWDPGGDADCQMDR